MKRAFTLVEVLISITLFSIIMIFLYQALEVTKNSNKFYESKLKVYEDNNNLKNIFYEDFATAVINDANLTMDKNKNSIISIKTDNTFHNPFYQNISYFVSKEKELIRVESKNPFNPKKIPDDFFDSAYIDTLYDKIELFKISKNKEYDKSYTIAIKRENEKIFYITTIILR